MTSERLTVRLEKLAYGGDALGRLADGRAVFVPFSLPGETVCIHITEEKTGHVRAELVEVLEPSTGRIEPKCRHFGVCGGCHYQHLPYQTQLAFKTEILRDQLTRIGKVMDPPVMQIIPSLTGWNYRNHVQFHLDSHGKLGTIDTHRRSILPIRECCLPEPPLDLLWPMLEFESGLELERVSLRLGIDDQIMLVLESSSNSLPGLELEADLSVVHLTGQDAVVMAGEDHLTMRVNDRMFRLSAASFFQVNTAMAERMVTHLLENLQVSPTVTLLEVYCGVGLFSAFFAPRVGRLIGIESSPSACEDFVFNLDEFDNVELYEGFAEEVLPALDVRSDVVIVDPPRAGLAKSLLDALLTLGPRTLAYVSCDPSTLARDAARFIAGGYRLIQVTPFDVFPQTYHIESISIFQKEQLPG
jgi:23S rRNA (uracil1939-C5)-methyltransferase